MLAYGRFPEVCSKSTNVRHVGGKRHLILIWAVWCPVNYSHWLSGLIP